MNAATWDTGWIIPLIKLIFAICKWLQGAFLAYENSLFFIYGAIKLVFAYSL